MISVHLFKGNIYSGQ